MPYAAVTQVYQDRLDAVLSSRTYYDSLVRGFSDLQLTESEAKNVVAVLQRVLDLELSLENLGNELQKILIRDKDEIITVEEKLCYYALVFVADVFPVDVAYHLESLEFDVEAFTTYQNEQLRLLQSEIRQNWPQVSEQIDAFLQDSDSAYDAAMEELQEAIVEASRVEDYGRERQKFLDVLKTGLVSYLSSDDYLDLAILNARFIATLDNSDTFYFNRVKQVVADNAETATNTSLIIDGKERPGMVKNWIRDYNLYRKDQPISMLTVSDYMSTGRNPLRLSANERMLVGKILEFYHMVQNSPNSFIQLPREEWYLFPMPDVSDVLGTKLTSAKEQFSQRIANPPIISGSTTQNANPVSNETVPPTSDSVEIDHEPQTLAPHETVHLDELSEVENVLVSESERENNDAVKKVPPLPTVTMSIPPESVANEKTSIVPPPAPPMPKKAAPVSKIIDKKPMASKGMMSQEEIAQKYAGDPNDNKKVEEAVKKVSKLTGQNSRQLVAMLVKVLSDKNKTDKFTVIAILKVLAETNGFSILLKDTQIQKLVSAYVKKNNLLGQWEQFERDDNFTQRLIIVLQYILSDKLGLSVDEAARIGLQLANVQKRIEGSFTDLARFNLHAGSFEWNL